MTEKLAETILENAKGGKRFFVAIAGPPASGKTTFTESLEKNLQKKTSVSIVAMDGFHFDNVILKQKNLFDRKGSPATFDVTSLHLLLTGLQHQTDTLAAPVFDRENDLTRSSAKLIQPDDHIILVEGNYLLCKTEPWSKLHSLFNYTISISAPIQTLEQRLVQRWLDHDHAQEQAEARANHNDLPNARYVIQHSIPSNITIQT